MNKTRMSGVRRTIQMHQLQAPGLRKKVKSSSEVMRSIFQSGEGDRKESKKLSLKLLCYGISVRVIID